VSSFCAILEYYRQEVAKLSKPASTTKVRLKPPTQVSTLYTMDGRQTIAGPDGTFEVLLDDAQPLLASGWQMLTDAGHMPD
jgi:hypothetical protein